MKLFAVFSLVAALPTLTGLAKDLSRQANILDQASPNELRQLGEALSRNAIQKKSEPVGRFDVKEVLKNHAKIGTKRKRIADAPQRTVNRLDSSNQVHVVVLVPHNSFKKSNELTPELKLEIDKLNVELEKMLQNSK